jgi:hypothetical protein
MLDALKVENLLGDDYEEVKLAISCLERKTIGPGAMQLRRPPVNTHPGLSTGVHVTWWRGTRRASLLT